ncbi:MAG TPA: hypothetical protein VNL18_05360 [Gemmatimonadales bacterium]|nr:hypothetical protein [Gemmatimonadales bacterium]
MTSAAAAAVVAATFAFAARARAQDSAATDQRLPPAGFGTLRQEDVAVRLETGTFALRVMPLDEAILRLLAPDSYASLRRLRETKEREIHEAAERAAVTNPVLFVVTFFGLQHQARFVGEDVTIASRNRLFRPVAILPISPRWHEQQLLQRETATAVYLYEDGIALLEPFTVSYGGMNSNHWERILPTLDRERAAIIARAAGARPPYNDPGSR